MCWLWIPRLRSNRSLYTCILSEAADAVQLYFGRWAFCHSVFSTLRHFSRNDPGQQVRKTLGRLVLGVEFHAANIASSKLRE
jgi:hypothetical protein